MHLGSYDTIPNNHMLKLHYFSCVRRCPILKTTNHFVKFILSRYYVIEFRQK